MDGRGRSGDVSGPYVSFASYNNGDYDQLVQYIPQYLLPMKKTIIILIRKLRAAFS